MCGGGGGGVCVCGGGGGVNLKLNPSIIQCYLEFKSA